VVGRNRSVVSYLVRGFPAGVLAAGSLLGSVAGVIGHIRCVIAADSPARWSAGLVPAGSHALLAPAVRSLGVFSPCLQPRFLGPCCFACWTGLRTRDALAGPRACCRGRTLLPSRCCDERCRCCRPPLLLCRPAPQACNRRRRTSGHAETAGHPPMLYPLDSQLSYALLAPGCIHSPQFPVSSTLCWPPALLSRSPRFQDSRYCHHSLCSVSLTLSRPRLCWYCCWTLGQT
jgi:hypothetical protein